MGRCQPQPARGGRGRGPRAEVPDVAEEPQVQVEVHAPFEVVEEVFAVGLHGQQRPSRQPPGVLGEAPLRRVGGEPAAGQPAMVDAREPVDDVSFGHPEELTQGEPTCHV